MILGLVSTRPTVFKITKYIQVLTFRAKACLLKTGQTNDTTQAHFEALPGRIWEK
jgi:hypothetical protein